MPDHDDAVLLRVHRSPNIPAFLVSGGLVGALVGVLVDVFGPTGRCPQGAATTAACTSPYQPSSSLTYLLVLGAILGLILGAAAAVLLEKALNRGR